MLGNIQAEAREFVSNKNSVSAVNFLEKLPFLKFYREEIERKPTGQGLMQLWNEKMLYFFMIFSSLP